jgi:hypothetical protein
MESRSEMFSLRRGLAAAMLAAAILLCGSSAISSAAQGPWSGPEELTSVERSGSPQVAIAPDETSTAVWYQGSGDEAALMFSDKAEGSPNWSAAKTITIGSRRVIGQPVLAIGADGTTVVAFVSHGAADSRGIVMATRSPGESFTQPETVTEIDNPDATIFDPKVVAAPDGAVTVTWRLETIIEHHEYPMSNVTKREIQASTRPAGGSFGPAANLGAPGEYILDGPDAAVAPDGTTTVVWSSSFTGIKVRVATAPPGSGFGAPETLNPSPGDAYFPEVETSADGSTIVGWQGGGVMITRRPSDGSFGAPMNISPGEAPNGMTFGVADDGAVTAAYSLVGGSSSSIRVVNRAAGGTLTPPKTISGNGDGYLPRIDVAGNGRAIVAWLQDKGLDVDLHSAYRPPAGDFFAPQFLTEHFDNFSLDLQQVSITSSGTNAIAWTQSEGNSSSVFAATLFGSLPTVLSQQLSNNTRDSGPEIATGGDGDTTTAWTRSSASGGVIQALTSGADGLLPPEQHDLDISDPARLSESPSIAAGPGGTTAIAWQSSFDGGNRQVQVATKSGSGEISSPLTVSGLARDSARPEVAIGTDGTKALIWRDRAAGGSTWRIMAAVAEAGETFGEPLVIAVDSLPDGLPQVAVTSGGAVITVWTAASGRVRLSTRLPGGNFGEPVTLSPAREQSSSPQIAVGPQGTAAVAWRNVGNAATGLFVTTRKPDGTFRTAIRLDRGSRLWSPPQVGIGPGGRATVIWQGGGGAGSTPLVATDEGTDHKFSSSKSLSGSGDRPVNVSPDVTSAPDGTMTVVWQSGNTTDSVIGSATREPGRSFKPAVLISQPDWYSRLPQVSIGPDGAASAAWRSNGDVISWSHTLEGPGSPVCRGTLKFKGTKKHRRRGMVSLRFKSGGPGKVSLIGSRRVRPAATRVYAKGTGSVTVRARGLAGKRLRRHGRVRVSVLLRFKPRNGCRTVRKTEKVVLLRRR